MARRDIYRKVRKAIRKANIPPPGQPALNRAGRRAIIFPARKIVPGAKRAGGEGLEF